MMLLALKKVVQYWPASKLKTHSYELALVHHIITCMKNFAFSKMCLHANAPSFRCAYAHSSVYLFIMNSFRITTTGFKVPYA